MYIMARCVSTLFEAVIVHIMALRIIAMMSNATYFQIFCCFFKYIMIDRRFYLTFFQT